MKSRSDRKLFKLMPPEPRRKILAYIDAPTYPGWVKIRDIIISHNGQTLGELTVDKRWYGTHPHSIVVARASYLAEARDKDLAVMEQI
jgi:hypothetical protein